MKFFLFVLLCCNLSVLAQETEAWATPSKESQAYTKLREKITVPPFGLTKIKNEIARIKSDEDDNKKIPVKFYQSLSLREKFTYHMIHGETYSQNCDAMPPAQDAQKKIFAHLPDLFGEYSWSDTQLKFFIANRDSVLQLIKESASRSNHIGVNFKQAIIELNAREMIPFLISTYNSKKEDHDILTVLMLLMKDNQYPPFLASVSYKKLYGDENNYQAFLQFNPANEELIIKRATEYFNGSNNK
jgi:hypothetical protein